MKLISSVGILLVEGGGTFLLQHRDDRQDIFYPGKIGLFGGEIEVNESPLEAAMREIREELSIEIQNLKLVSILNLDILSTQRTRKRYFYVFDVNSSFAEKIDLKEGQAIVKVNKNMHVNCSDFVPYDLAFILDYIYGLPNQLHALEQL